MLRVFHQLHLSHAALFQAVDRSLRKQEGLSTAHLIIIFALSSEPDLTSSDVCKRTGHSKSRLTGLVNTLEDRGLIKRSSSETDGRVSSLSLTDDGKALAERHKKLTRKVNEELLAPFSNEERDTIAGFLNHIQDISSKFDRSGLD
jgi:DNA-binding MarR family transcriptional regulator